MASWGSKLNEAWNAASDAGREAASRVAAGAVVVGQQAVRAARAAKAGAIWLEEKAEAAAKWAAEQTKRAAQWAYEQAKRGVRQGVKAIADPLFSGISKVQDAWNSAKGLASRIADQVSDAAAYLRKKFGLSKPHDSSQKCQVAAPATDVDHDGTLIGKDCKPVTKKGEELTRASVEKAEANSVRDDSTCCQKKRARGEATGSIAYVNGINTDKETHCKTLRAIAAQTCKNVFGVFNATEEPKLGNVSLADAAQTSKDRRLIRQADEGKVPKVKDGRNPAVDTLSDLIDIKSSAGEPLELWAHSQGGAVASLALYEADRQGRTQGRSNPLKNISVSSYGSAAPSWIDGPKYTHYVHVNDATPLLFGLGDDPAYDKGHAGEGAKVIRISGEPDGALRDDSSGAALDTHFFPDPTKYHGIDGDGNTYLRMQKEKNGGCP